MERAINGTAEVTSERKKVLREFPGSKALGRYKYVAAEWRVGHDDLV
jgi:hypothetical protein